MSTSSSRQSPASGSHYQPSLPVVAIIIALFVLTALVVVHATNTVSAVSAPATHTHTLGGHKQPSSTPSSTVPQIKVSPSQVSLQVANGTSVSGLARTFTEQLQTLGWDTLSAINGPHVAATEIFWRTGYTWAAAEVATQLKVPQSALRPLGNAKPVAGASGDDLVVILGPDAGR